MGLDFWLLAGIDIQIGVKTIEWKKKPEEIKEA